MNNLLTGLAIFLVSSMLSIANANAGRVCAKAQTTDGKVVQIACKEKRSSAERRARSMCLNNIGQRPCKIVDVWKE